MAVPERRMAERLGPREGPRPAVPCLAQVAGWLVLCLASGCATLRRSVPQQTLIEAQALSLRASDAQSTDWAQAREWFDEAVRMCPTDVQTRLRYAEALRAHGELPEALAQMRVAAELAGNQPQVQLAYARLLLESGQWAEAERISRDLAERLPRHSEALALRGAVLKAQQRSDLARVFFHQALHHDRGHVGARLALAEIAYESNRYRRCLAMLRALRSETPRRSVPWKADYLEGLALRRLKRFDEAAIAFARSREAGCNAPEAWWLEARCWQDAGRRDAADRALQALQARFPAFRPAEELVAEDGPTRNSLHR